MDGFIERRALWMEIARIQGRRERDGQLLLAKAIDLVIRLVENFPAADVAPVVRCKDCKHSSFVKSCSKYECRKGFGALKYSNDFCSYGERKDGD